MDNLDREIDSKSEYFTSDYDARVSKTAEHRHFFKVELDKMDAILHEAQKHLEEERRMYENRKSYFYSDFLLNMCYFGDLSHL